MWSEALSFFPKFVCHHFFSTTRCSEVGYGLSNSSERSVATSNFFSVTRTSLSDVFSNSLQRSSASPSPISHTPFAPGARFFFDDRNLLVRGSQPQGRLCGRSSALPTFLFKVLPSSKHWEHSFRHQRLLKCQRFAFTTISFLTLEGFFGGSLVAASLK